LLSHAAGFDAGADYCLFAIRYACRRLFILAAAAFIDACRCRLIAAVLFSSAALRLSLRFSLLLSYFATPFQLFADFRSSSLPACQMPFSPLLIFADY